MPLYDITLEDGRKLRIEADDEAAAGAGAAHWLQSNPTPDSGFGSALMAGAASAVSGTGKTLKQLGATDTGAWLEDTGAKMAPENYRPALDETKNPRDDQYKLSDVPAVGRFLPSWGVRGLARSVVEGAPTMAADLTAGRLAGPVGVVGSHMLQTYGPALEEVVANRTAGDPKADATPTTRDKLQAALTSGAESGLQVLPINKILAGKAVTKVGLPGVAQAGRNIGEATAAGAGASAAGDLIHQVGTTASAPKGPKVDLENTGIAGLTGGVTAGAFRAPKSLGVEAYQAARYADLGGEVAPGATALANRITTRAEGQPLDRTKASAVLTRRDSGERLSRDATQGAINDVLAELGDATRGIQHPDRGVMNTLVDVQRTGRDATPVSDRALRQLAEAMPDRPDVVDLARQAVAAQRLVRKGTLDDRQFTGGASATAADFVKRHPIIAAGALLGKGLGGYMLGGAATGGLGIGAGLAGYYGLRALGRANGSYLPAKTFTEKFADPSVPVRREAPQPPQEPEAPAPARPGPTGPGIKPTPTPWGAEQPDYSPEIAAAEAALKRLAVLHKAPKFSEVAKESRELMKGIAEVNRMREEATPKPAPPTSVDFRAVSREARDIMKGLENTQRIKEEHTATAEPTLQDVIKETRGLVSGLSRYSKARDKTIADQQKQTGAQIAEQMGAESPYIAENGGIDLATTPGFAQRAGQLLSAAGAYKRLTANPGAEEAVVPPQGGPGAPAPAPAAPKRLKKSPNQRIAEMDAQRQLIEARIALAKVKQGATPPSAEAQPGTVPPVTPKASPAERNAPQAAAPEAPAASPEVGPTPFHQLARASWAGMDPESAANLIADNYEAAGKTYKVGRPNFVANTARRVQAKTTMASALSKAFPDVGLETLDATLQAVPTRAAAREFRVMLKAHNPDAAQLIDKVMTDKKINNTWFSEGTSEPEAAKPEAPPELKKLVAAAKARGTVTVKSNKPPPANDDGLDIPDFLKRTP